MDKTILAWIERAHDAEAQTAALLADVARAASALVEKNPERARDILINTFIESARADMTAIIDVTAERRRQIDVEGWTPEFDDIHHSPETLALAGAAYAVSASQATLEADGKTVDPESMWPFTHEFRGANKDVRRKMVIAAALLLAAVEAHDRAMIRQYVAPES